MVDALVPALCTLRKLRIVAYSVERGLQDAVLPRLGIVGHVEDMTLTVATNLVDKLREAGSASEIDVCVGLDAVTVAARDDKLIPLARKRGGITVLLPVAQSVKLQRMDVLPVDGEELVDEDVVTLTTDAVEVPDGMVEDDEDLGEFVKLSKNLPKKTWGTLGDGDGSQGAQTIHPLGS
jgi:hypothetical protein